MSAFRIRTVTAAGACAAAVAFTAPAQAGVTWPSEVTMKQSQNNDAKFKGKVTSSQDACVVGRKVQIFRVEPGDDQKVTKTFASESGRYRVIIPMQAGEKLYAVIKVYDSPLGTRCGSDQSEIVNA